MLGKRLPRPMLSNLTPSIKKRRKSDGLSPLSTTTMSKISSTRLSPQQERKLMLSARASMTQPSLLLIRLEKTGPLLLSTSPNLSLLTPQLVPKIARMPSKTNSICSMLSSQNQTLSMMTSKAVKTPLLPISSLKQEPHGTISSCPTALSMDLMETLRSAMDAHGESEPDLETDWHWIGNGLAFDWRRIG